MTIPYHNKQEPASGLIKQYSKDNDSTIVEHSENTKPTYISVIVGGIGMVKKHLSKISDRFYQIFKVQEKTSPVLGISLYLIQQIIKKRKGKIWMESKKILKPNLIYSYSLINKVAYIKLCPEY